MLTQDLWSEIRFMRKMGKSIKKISRVLSISKNTVRKALRSDLYQPYTRENSKPGLLSEFIPFLTERAPQVDFNAVTLLRELKKQGYTGSYTILKEAVRPLGRHSARWRRRLPALKPHPGCKRRWTGAANRLRSAAT